MAHAYTPGLRVAKSAVVRQRRALPLKGQVLVATGDRVQPGDEVARTDLPGNVHSVNVTSLLGIEPGEIRTYMLKKEGDPVARDEAIAETQPLIKWFRRQCTSPIEGTVERVSEITGQVLLREPPRPVRLFAYVGGKVVEIIPDEGVVIETPATFVQGIFGVGGETWGELDFAVDSPDRAAGPDDLRPEHRGKIVVAGRLAGASLIDGAKRIGVKALVVGGIHDADLKALLGYDLGVAITGSEEIGLTLVITEGFGEVPMAQGTFDLLRSRAGDLASVSGATQIRAGVLRPEIIIPLTEEEATEPAAAESLGMKIGDEVRLMRTPYFGRIGAVQELPTEPVKIETEAEVRVARIKLGDGEVVTVPRANVELIQA